MRLVIMKRTLHYASGGPRAPLPVVSSPARPPSRRQREIEVDKRATRTKVCTPLVIDSESGNDDDLIGDDENTNFQVRLGTQKGTGYENS